MLYGLNLFTMEQNFAIVIKFLHTLGQMMTFLKEELDFSICGQNYKSKDYY
jgi:hypothetical protein